MKELSCNCGFTVKNEDPTIVEARMWHHAIQDHIEMLQSMTKDQLVGWLTETHKQIGLQS